MGESFFPLDERRFILKEVTGVEYGLYFCSDFFNFVFWRGDYFFILYNGESVFFINFEDLSFYNSYADFFYVFYFPFFAFELAFYSTGTGDFFFLPRLHFF